MLKIDQSVKMREIGLEWELHGPAHRLLRGILWARTSLSEMAARLNPSVNKCNPSVVPIGCS